jgi:predicted 2-oxoglutarate/Fe(II)-dependent dioxygenase YbiX/peroxiredoxin
MIHLAPGDFAPDFVADSSINPQFRFNMVAGHQVLLIFLVAGGDLPDTIRKISDTLSKSGLQVFLVSVEPADRGLGGLDDLARRFTIFWDFEAKIFEAFGISPDGAGGAILLRKNMRMERYVEAGRYFRADLLDALGKLNEPESDQSATNQAPVLLIPDTFSRSMCGRLIAYYDAHGGNSGSFMRDVDGRTRMIQDTKLKRRRDCEVTDLALVEEMRRLVSTRVVPEVKKAFQFQITRVERYLIGCYEDSDRGFFRAHRDNTSLDTAHRRFAMSVNLNTGEYEGGSLRFPEYGAHTYHPDVGGAVVFSCSLLHEATPVTKGRRLVFLPFFYDEAAVELRARNQETAAGRNED